MMLYQHDFLSDTGDFVLEGEGTYEIADGKLILDDSKSQSGLTLWVKHTFNRPLLITYEAEVLEPEIANNLNLFMMAQTLQGGPIWSEPHSGAYPDYHDSSSMYIFTMTGNMAGSEELTGWSRLRRNPGFDLLSEEPSVKTELGKVYRLEYMLFNQRIQCSINGKVVHQIEEELPILQGSIGFRTWKTRLCIRRLRIQRLTE